MRLLTVVLSVMLLGVVATRAHAADTAAPFRDCPDCPEMQRIPSGTFLLGTAGVTPANADRAESQPVVVRIARPFALGRFEVTRREYLAFVTDTGHESTGPCVTWDETLNRFVASRERGASNPGRPKELADDQPVSCVSFNDATAYVHWLAKRTGKPYRLPSEAEWEYAARAGATTLYPWGDSPGDACEFANVYDQSARDVYPLGWDPVPCRDNYPDVAPVGALRANGFGLHDLIGNVAEWVEDCYTDSSVGRPKDGRAWVWANGCRLRVRRGGSWVTPAEQARVGYREAALPGERADSVGFRVALDMDGRGEAH